MIITQDKTNYKFLLLVIILAAIVVVGILIYQNQTTVLPINSFQNPSQACYKDADCQEGEVCLEGTCNNLGLANWNYQREINIDNSKNQYSLNNYPVLIEMDTANLIEEKKLSSNCSDIRFADWDNKEELSYWIESGCNTGKTKIWVKIPNIPKKSDIKIYLYYGNPEASAKNNKYETVGIAGGDFVIKKIEGVNAIKSVTNCVRNSTGYLYCGFIINDSKIYLLRSKDGGQTWEDVYADQSPNGGGHFSSIGIDSKDNIHML